MRTIKGVERRCVRVDIRAITELSIRVQFSVKAQVAKKDSAWTEMVCASSAAESWKKAACAQC